MGRNGGVAPPNPNPLIPANVVTQITSMIRVIVFGAVVRVEMRVMASTEKFAQTNV